ncbi:hypothetical protein [Acidocella aromatica]|uniref:hypothetical protein n=1 Tax=Acidocella aromatica TaxID=1303579 RepID=UPI001C844489|nr:hypothetical protein [Acidocella aromatica]
MERLMQPDQLRAHIRLWAEEEIRLDRLPPKSGEMLEALIYRKGSTADPRLQNPHFCAELRSAARMSRKAKSLPDFVAI